MSDRPVRPSEESFHPLQFLLGVQGLVMVGALSLIFAQRWDASGRAATTFFLDNSWIAFNPYFSISQPGIRLPYKSGNPP